MIATMKQAVVILIPSPFDPFLYLGITRRNDPSLVGLIGGNVEPSELLEGAAFREAYEESGLEISLVSPYPIFTYHDGEYISHAFLAHPASGRMVASDEGTLVWCKPSTLVNPKKTPFSNYVKALFKAWPHLRGM